MGEGSGPRQLRCWPAVAAGVGELEGEEVAQLLLRRQQLAEHRLQRGGGQLRIVEGRQLEKMQQLFGFRSAPYLNFFIILHLHSTTLQSVMNKQRSWHCHENVHIKRIQTIPHNL